MSTSPKSSLDVIAIVASLSLAGSGLAGCGGTITFQGKSPIAIAGSAPVEAAPPPEKEEPKGRVKIKDDKIEIDEKIQFELNSHIIKSESHSLMDEITDVVQKHPEIKKISIEGHASSDGDDNANLALSDRRAKSVMDYLVKKGVKADRLTAKGYGEQKPIADNGSEEGRVKNRRVEFNITEREKK